MVAILFALALAVTTPAKQVNLLDQQILTRKSELARKPYVRRLITETASRSGTHTGRHIMKYHSVDALLWIIYKESSYNPRCKDPRSTSYGLCGFLNAQWPEVNMKKTNIPSKQLEAMYRYIDKRYKGDPYVALRFWKRHGWY